MLLVTAGTPGTGQTVSQWTPTSPGSHQTGDLLLLLVAGHGGTSTGVDPGNGLIGSGADPQGFVYLKGITEGVSGVASSTDIGSMMVRAYAKVATSTTDLWPTHAAGPNMPMYQAFIFRPDAGEEWRDTLTETASWVQTAGDSTTADPLTGTAGAWSSTPPETGDAVVAFGAIPTDSGTDPTPTITCAGLAGGTFIHSYLETAGGVDGAIKTSVWEGFTGAATAGLAMSFPFGATAGSQNAGAMLAIAIRSVEAGTVVEVDGELTGSGAFTGTVVEVEQVAANLAGSGAFAASTIEVELVAADLTGSGDFTALIEEGGAPSVIGNLTGSGEFTAIAEGPPEVAVNLTGSGAFSLVVDEVAQPITMLLRIIDPDQRRSPTTLTVVLSGAFPDGYVSFVINALTPYLVRADYSGDIVAASIPVPELDAGAHTLTATATNADGTVRAASAAFTLMWGSPPRHVPGPDADPVEVPGAVNEDGSRNWVLQDLMPGGLGSWVMPRNPAQSNRPLASRELTPSHTTALAGQHHVFEAVDDTHDWTFSGVLFTQAEHQKLEAYFTLNRRFYLIDDYNRAWIVTFGKVEVTPRLRTRFSLPGESDQLSDWVAEYSVTATVYGTTWHDPVPL